MKIIECLSKNINKEIETAHKYALEALEYKETEPIVAETYYKLATNKLNDVTILHGTVTTLINNYKKEHGEPPAHMLILYRILHGQSVENMAAVKGMLALYKGD